MHFHCLSTHSTAHFWPWSANTTHPSLSLLPFSSGSRLIASSSNSHAYTLSQRKAIEAFQMTIARSSGHHQINAFSARLKTRKYMDIQIVHSAPEHATCMTLTDADSPDKHSSPPQAHFTCTQKCCRQNQNKQNKARPSTLTGQFRLHDGDRLF